MKEIDIYSLVEKFFEENFSTEDVESHEDWLDVSDSLRMCMSYNNDDVKQEILDYLKDHDIEIADDYMDSLEDIIWEAAEKRYDYLEEEFSDFVYDKEPYYEDGEEY